MSVQPKSGALVAKNKNGKQDGSVKKGKNSVKVLLQENKTLQEEKDAITKELDDLKTKFSVLGKKILDHADKAEYGLEDDLDPLQVNLDDLLGMLSKVISRDKKKNRMETRIEELETRVTQLTVEQAELLRVRAKYEEGLSEICQCYDMPAVKVLVEKIRVEADIPPHFLEYPHGYCTSTGPLKHPPPHIVPANVLNTPKPRQRLPGDTHIRNMLKELKVFIIKELNMEKPSRADWRTLALRVGIPESIIEKWRYDQLDSPCSHVLAKWSESCAATVRMLHRHLLSPQLRSIILVRRIEDFYDVE
ncbi:uncharacterized protein LOC106157437 [Lingula anatina]|uniref:Uncharacterized protein LOC106157437 n=1 Tax=Lingula anatina TaxID=7574 RepID=A0A1S3HR64_LINAN|nr:uncharacterized protein LOC106157437 [Lingula anatina]XP_013388528.1 uncharacterized protein LOC106157437 [Lingula anatina]|eukprot:XP_013388527.1 uncharacterized protein LOC106157437 [Lingula anatina]